MVSQTQTSTGPTEPVDQLSTRLLFGVGQIKGVFLTFCSRVCGTSVWILLEFLPRCTNVSFGVSAGRDERVPEDPGQTGPGDGRGHDRLQAEGRASDRPGHHGDMAGGLDSNR